MLGVIALSGCVWLVPAPSGAQTAKELSAADVAQIKAATQAMAKAALAKDWPAWGSLFAADAVALPPNGPTLAGRAAIQAWGAQVSHLTEFTLTPTEVRGRDDLAYVVGTYSVTSQPPGGAGPVKDTGKFLEVRRRQKDGKWLIEANCWNSDSPPASAAR